MARPDLPTLRNTLEFQHLYHWEVEIVTPPAAGFLEYDPDRWNLQAFSYELPRRTVENAQLDIRGHRIHEPGRVIPAGELSLVYVETTDAFVRSFIKSWTEGIANRVAPVPQLLADFAFISLDGIGGPGNETPNYEYLVQMAYLRDTTPPTHDGGTNDPAQWTLILQYNDFVEGLPGTTGG